MRILVLSNNDGGLYKFRKELLEKLCEDNTVTCSVPESDGFVDKIEALGCKCVKTTIDRRGKNPLKDFKLFKFYLEIIKKEKPDVVLTYTIKPNIYGGLACQKTKTPYIANVTGLGTAIENGGLLQNVSLTLYRLGLKKAQKVFFQNTENRDFMLKHKVVKNNYDMLPGSGVNLAQFNVSPFPETGKVEFIFVARVMKEKGIDQYLDAAKVIRQRHPETRFHVCGACEESYEAKLKELTDNGTIIYHGLVKDMKPIYELASCTVHPTYYPEGLSNVLLESLASGRPIITTNRSGCREVVEDGVNGYLVEQKNSADLIDKLEAFLLLSVDERMQMGLNGRKKVEKEFDRRLIVEKYLEAIKCI